MSAVALTSGIVAPLFEQARPVKFARFEAVAGETVEIVIGDVAVRIGSDVEPERLAAVNPGRFGKNNPGRCSGLRGPDAGRLPQGSDRFDGSGARWRS